MILNMVPGPRTRSDPTPVIVDELGIHQRHYSPALNWTVPVLGGGGLDRRAATR